MNMTLKPAFGLSGSALKVIAMISMGHCPEFCVNENRIQL